MGSHVNDTPVPEEIYNFESINGSDYENKIDDLELDEDVEEGYLKTC